MLQDYFMVCIIVWIVLIPVALISWNNQKNKLGNIRCKRCNHVGLAQGLWIPFRGTKPVCQKCQSEDWVAIQLEHEPTQGMSDRD